MMRRLLERTALLLGYPMLLLLLGLGLAFVWLASSEEQRRGYLESLGLDLTYAWSLIHFLVQEPQRQLILTDYLNTLAANRCRPFDHLAYLQRTYPGGIQALESAWTDWLMREQARSVTF